jgi:hypothetical protein
MDGKHVTHLACLQLLYSTQYLGLVTALNVPQAFLPLTEFHNFCNWPKHKPAHFLTTKTELAWGGGTSRCFHVQLAHHSSLTRTNSVHWPGELASTSSQHTAQLSTRTNQKAVKSAKFLSFAERLTCGTSQPRVATFPGLTKTAVHCCIRL